ncbi:MAG: GNAT family protein [Acidobacteriota bacterium]
MNTVPRLESKRLILRPFSPEDAGAVQALVDDPDIASTTLHIPHPYTLEMAQRWIAVNLEKCDRGEISVWGVALKPGRELVGANGLIVHPEGDLGEMGFWVGKRYWNRGYCTEAAGLVMDYAFSVLRLNKVFAQHFTRNPASGKVLQKLGMSHEGRLRQHVRKDDHYEDLEVYGILKREWSRLEA